VVFIFAKTANDALAGLVKEVDALVAAQQEKKLAAVVNIIGEPTDDLKAKIKVFGDTHGVKKTPLTVTTDGQKFKVTADAEVTVMLYRGKKVKYNFALAKGELNTQMIAQIVDSTNKMVAAPPDPDEQPKPKPKAKDDSKGKEKPAGKEKPKAKSAGKS
jgi:hypothetical protein